MKELGILTDYGNAEIKWIRDFEKRHSIKFPFSYINLMLEHNGVNFYKNHFNYFNKHGTEVTGSFSFCGFGELPLDNINDFQTEDLDHLNTQGLITFGLDGGGYHISFDYRQNPMTDNPPIVIEYHNGDIFIDEKGQEKFLVLPVANNFDDFIDMLYEA